MRCAVGEQAICIGTCSLRKVDAGAYLWLFLNLALGLESVGCRVLWLTTAFAEDGEEENLRRLAALERALRAQAVKAEIVVAEEALADAAAEADLFVNLAYHPADVVGRFRRAAFVDIDPGLTQLWTSRGELEIAAHDVYFTFGETVGRRGSRIPDCGLSWRYLPPPVHTPAWKAPDGEAGTAFTTVSNWWGSADGDWQTIDGELLDNSKRGAFLDYLDLPSRVGVPLELALPLSADDSAEVAVLVRHGWNVRSVDDVSATPEAHREYIWRSRGEFSCMKRAYAVLETAWIGERALNYLASGRPVVVQDTGRSAFLPENEGVLRFSSPDEAATRLRDVEENYVRHSAAARALAREFYDARDVAARLLAEAG
jgi:hypothetical protein